MEHLDFRPVLIAWARLQAEVMGRRKCSKKGVGGLIRFLRENSYSGVPDVFGNDGRKALTLLETHCRLCGRCRTLTDP